MIKLEEGARDVKYVGRVPGRYSLPQHVTDSNVSIFACRTQGITPAMATICAPVNGSIGDPVSANFDQLGIVHGAICRHVDGGFAMELDPFRNDLEILSQRIAWLKRRKGMGIADNRAHKRFIPRRAITFVILADGQIKKCFIVDMSASGVAVSMDYQPPIGTRLAVGTVVGSVVRHLDVGFAVAFSSTQPLDDLERRIVRQLQDLLPKQAV